jgi:hypothetical protein
LDLNNVDFGLLRKLLKKQSYMESLDLVKPHEFLGGRVQYNHNGEKEENQLMSRIQFNIRGIIWN